VAARKDDAFRAILADERAGNVAGMDFAVNARFAHPARDQLCVLSAEIEDENLFVMHYSMR
jgi:hypothetical protein